MQITNFGRGPKFLAGSISERTGPISYKVKLTDGRVVKRHQDHVLHHYAANETQFQPFEAGVETTSYENTSDNRSVDKPPEVQSPPIHVEEVNMPNEESVVPKSVVASPLKYNRPKRIIKPVERLNL